MKTPSSLFAALAVALFAQTSHANPTNVAYARVVEARPVYERVEKRQPERICRIETVAREYTTDSGRRATPVVLGGVLGGAVGHAVGHGHDNKKIGAAVGAVLGAAIGSDLERQNRRPATRHVQYEDVERCEYREHVSTHEQLVGYDVTYQYSGTRYTTHMPRHPGDRIKVAVDVRPIGY